MSELLILDYLLKLEHLRLWLIVLSSMLMVISFFFYSLMCETDSCTTEEPRANMLNVAKTCLAVIMVCASLGFAIPTSAYYAESRGMGLSLQVLQGKVELR
jgi:uncharacterized membrane protein YjgN (DUF898 family)